MPLQLHKEELREHTRTLKKKKDLQKKKLFLIQTIYTLICFQVCLVDTNNLDTSISRNCMVSSY